jgi:hypothetical protein
MEGPVIRIYLPVLKTENFVWKIFLVREKGTGQDSVLIAEQI